MIIELPKDLERFVHEEFLSGCYVRQADDIRHALKRLWQTSPKAAHATDQDKRPSAASRSGRSRSPRRNLIGLSRLPGS